jgi:predicted nucleic acid-binding protein
VILIADTSGIVAASDSRAPENGACRRLLGEAGTVVVPPLVLAEVDHVSRARFGGPVRSIILDAIVEQVRRMRFVVPQVSPDVLVAARGVQRRYGDLDLGLADGVIMALAAECRTPAVLTLDRRDFRTIRPLTPHDAFLVLPDDEPSARSRGDD